MGRISETPISGVRRISRLGDSARAAARGEKRRDVGAVVLLRPGHFGVVVLHDLRDWDVVVLGDLRDGA